MIPSRPRTRLPRAHRALVAAALALALPAPAAAITVTTTADELNTDGDCSLREAIVAANTNTSRDACGSGSAAQKDPIVLASGATYSLTIPGPGGGGTAGELIINDNAGAVIDVELSVAGGGSATISQDAVPDSTIFAVAAGAKLVISDVVLRGGSLNAGGGGAAVVADGAALTLTRCVVRDNHATTNAGGIRNDGDLTVIDSSFIHNTSGTGGGAIGTDSDAQTIVSGSIFRDNVAQNGTGGAINNASTMSVQDSVFLNNRAEGPFGTGGAIADGNAVADMSSIGNSCFTGNTATHPGGAVTSFVGSAELGAVGNWWAASNGPKHPGGGNGDEVTANVDFGFALDAPPAACLPAQLLANGGFQTDVAGDGIPDRWTPSHLSGSEGRACKPNGKCTLRMNGSGQINQAAQIVPLDGSAGDTFTFHARARAQAVPAGGGDFRAELTIVHADGSQQVTRLHFASGTHGFEKLSQTVVANEAYRRIRVELRYSKASGRAHFDDVGVVLEP